MISDNASKSLIYQEFDDLKRKEFFDYQKSKFITNIDTLYYSVYFEIKGETEKGFERMIAYLDHVKESYNMLKDDLKEIKIIGDLVYKGKCFGPYSVGFEHDSKYVAFFVRTLTDKVPQIIVQLRSEYLWLNDYKYCIDESVDEILNFLSMYGITIDRVTENRLDFAYHTNYIQNIDRFFDSEMLGDNLVSHFKRWSKEGIFENGSLICDYISLGRRKSNDVFIRIYNKVQEVVNLKHKSYFLQLWLQNGLINKYDSWVYEQCFIESSYQKIDYYRLMFYYKNSFDREKRTQVLHYLTNFDNSDKKKIHDLADELTPVPTLVVNFEFQLKRKFTSDLKLEKITIYNSFLHRIYSVLDNLSNIHAYITHNVVRFVDGKYASRKKNCPNLYWWNLLRKSLKVDNFKLCRQYEINLEKKILKNKLVKNIATYSAYSGNVDQSIYKSVESIISEMNENDLDNFENYRKKRFAQVKNFIVKDEVDSDPE